MSPNAGAGPSAPFKLTSDERIAIGRELMEIANESTPFDHVSYCIDRIEAIINQGWQTCECELTQPK